MVDVKYADINAAETDQLISPRQACYLRKQYLRMKQEECSSTTKAMLESHAPKIPPGGTL